jgi:hypothetical protein
MFGRGGSSAADFLDAIDHAQHALNSSTKALKSSPLNLSEAKADLVAAIDKMNRIPSLNGEVDGMSSRLLALLQKQYELVQDVERAGELKFEHNRRIESNMRSMAEWFDEFNGWVERSGEDYGIRRKS